VAVEKIFEFEEVLKMTKAVSQTDRLCVWFSGEVEGVRFERNDYDSVAEVLAISKLTRWRR
jgi:hypothetical protein